MYFFFKKNKLSFWFVVVILLLGLLSILLFILHKFIFPTENFIIFIEDNLKVLLYYFSLYDEDIKIEMNFFFDFSKIFNFVQFQLLLDLETGLNLSNFFDLTRIFMYFLVKILFENIIINNYLYFQHQSLIKAAEEILSNPENALVKELFNVFLKNNNEMETLVNIIKNFDDINEVSNYLNKEKINKIQLYIDFKNGIDINNKEDMSRFFTYVKANMYLQRIIYTHFFLIEILNINNYETDDFIDIIDLLFNKQLNLYNPSYDDNFSISLVVKDGKSFIRIFDELSNSQMGHEEILIRVSDGFLQKREIVTGVELHTLNILNCIDFSKIINVLNYINFSKIINVLDCINFLDKIFSYNGIEISEVINVLDGIDISNSCDIIEGSNFIYNMSFTYHIVSFEEKTILINFFKELSDILNTSE